MPQLGFSFGPVFPRHPFRPVWFRYEWRSLGIAIGALILGSLTVYLVNRPPIVLPVGSTIHELLPALVLIAGMAGVATAACGLVLACSWRRAQFVRYQLALSKHDFNLQQNLDLLTDVPLRRLVPGEPILARFTVVADSRPDQAYWVSPGEMVYVSGAGLGRLLSATMFDPAPYRSVQTDRC